MGQCIKTTERHNKRILLIIGPHDGQRGVKQGKLRAAHSNGTCSMELGQRPALDLPAVFQPQKPPATPGLCGVMGRGVLLPAGAQLQLISEWPAQLQIAEVAFLGPRGCLGSG